MNKLKGIKVWRCLSLLWLLFLSAAYFWPTDVLYAITIWPPFVWAGLAFVLSMAGLRSHRSRTQLVLLASWIAFWIVFGEEWKWVPARFASPPANAFEVISLNCAGGSVHAAREGLSSRPKIALLQESPSIKELEKLVKEVYGDSGEVVAGPDASIIVDGSLTPINLNFRQSNFIAALAEPTGLPPVLIVSLRLQPPIFRLDYWNPDCWKSYAENRRLRREELIEVTEYLKDLAPERVIIGGDFNTPPDTGVFKPFDGWVSPATSNSGYSAVNEFPMARIDQVWAKGFSAHYSRAERTTHSDHRIVRVWFESKL